MKRGGKDDGITRDIHESGKIMTRIDSENE